MALYLLAGGNDRDYDEFGQNLNKFISGHVANPRILDVFFAVEEPRRDYKSAAWDEWYKKYFGQVERQSADVGKFLDQIDWADVIYFHGGTTDILIEAMKAYSTEKLRSLFMDKIVIGSSAGTNFLVSVNHSLKSGQVREGSGLVPLAAIVHYAVKQFDEKTYSSIDWQRIVRQVKERARADMPVLLLPEGTFTAIEL